MEKTAINFESMSFDEQSKIINACLTNCAKLINEKQLLSISEHGENNGMLYKESKTIWNDALTFRFENADELFNTAWINCMETYAINPLMPIALFVSKACGKALNGMFYQNAKRISNAEYIPTYSDKDNYSDDYSVIFEIERINEILSYVRDEIQANCAKVIDLLIMGYNFKEIAQMMDINIKTVYKYASAIANASAMVNCANAEFTTIENIIEHDILKRDAKAHGELENAIYKAYESFYKEKPKSVKQALARLKADCYTNYNADALKKAFYGK